MNKRIKVDIITDIEYLSSDGTYKPLTADIKYNPDSIHVTFEPPDDILIGNEFKYRIRTTEM